MNKILIGIAVYDTIQNDRTKYTIRTYDSLMKTVNFNTTRIFFINNGSCEKTVDFLKSIDNKNNVTVIHNKENKGTAEAINLAWKERDKECGEFCIKLDNDVVFHQYGWADSMIECINADPKIGILGAKRKDLPNAPTSKEYPTKLEYIHRKKGDKWHLVEICGDIIGTCLVFNPLLLDKIGYLWQPSLYGFDDNLACSRSLITGFYNAFYPYVEIDHIDSGGTAFTDWKKRMAKLYLKQIDKITKEYIEGQRSVYYNPFENKNPDK